ncbi:heterokaryon incompatibility protein-domain-containing protein [Diplogelasinospora grovesii]|uniref:Heterokaryon incompatibility protein-domain-containing protein n=1 Tax=Diplogelasinospora grovesii TaxID=303347 RepID=A0AAN6MZ51_9PEZI|nr:heterokaryon incompatibility protein-domain-containing protein [Diplogelasinospora grovesii]
MTCVCDRFCSSFANVSAFQKLASGETLSLDVEAALFKQWAAEDGCPLARLLNQGVFKRGITVSELPKTIQDAIYVTRNLGVRYLWVDALCILQDSDVDKSVQIGLMPEIYKHAVVTIVASSARNCHQGFLKERADLKRLHVDDFALLDLRASNDGGHEIVGSVWLFPPPRSRPEPIDLRAWTLQESVLSRRSLSYGVEQIAWQCLTEAHSDLGMRDAATEENERVPHARSLRHLMINNQAEVTVGEDSDLATGHQQRRRQDHQTLLARSDNQIYSKGTRHRIRYAAGILWNCA